MKRVARIIIRIVLTLILMFLSGILFIMAKNSIYLGGENQENTSYLSKNGYTMFGKEKEDGSLSAFFPKDFYDANVFLLGENHGFADAQRVDLTLLKHLNREIGLRYYIAEMDSLRAKKLNMYLEGAEPDNELLKRIVMDIGQRIPQQSGVQTLKKWKEVYDYNKGLPETLKIKIIGIDKDFDDDRTGISRDSLMVANFNNAVRNNHLQNEKFYGLFGFAHVLQGAYHKNGYHYFASRLCLAPFKEFYTVQSMICYNLDSEVYLPKNPQFPTPEDEKASILNDDGPITLVKGIKDMKKVTEEETISIFSLTGKESPYRNSQDLAGIKVNFFGEDVLPHESEKATTDLFQYVILIRNSEAIARLNK